MTSRGIKLGDFVKRGKRANGGGKFNQFQHSNWRSNALDSFLPKDNFYPSYASDYIDFSVNDVVFPETVDSRCINWAENDIEFVQWSNGNDEVKWSNGNNGRQERYSGGGEDWANDDVGHPINYSGEGTDWSNDNMRRYQRKNSEGSASNHSSPIQEVVGSVGYYGVDQFASPGGGLRREEGEGGITYQGTSPYYGEGFHGRREEVEGGITYYAMEQGGGGGEDFHGRREFTDPREDFHRRREFEDMESGGDYGEGFNGGQPERQIEGCFYVEDIEQYFESGAKNFYREGAKDLHNEAEEYYRGAELYYEEVPKEKIAEGMGLVELEEVVTDEPIKEVIDEVKGEKAPKEDGVGGIKHAEFGEVKEEISVPEQPRKDDELPEEQILVKATMEGEKLIGKKSKNTKKKLLPKKKVDEAFVHFPEESLVLTETDQRESAEQVEETEEKEVDLCSKDFELLQLVESIIGDDDDDDVDFDDREEDQD